MALTYYHQARIEALARKVSGTTAPLRMNDMEQTLFSQTGGIKRKSDEIAYYENKNTDGATVNRKLSDAGSTFWAANGAGPSTRADELEHTFYANGTFT
ncbi:MAG TPA: hypothetical protein VF974_07610 [Patescibacteria group bacterium]